MIVPVQISTSISRAELFGKALPISIEASARLAPRMNGAELKRLENYAEALAAVVADERRKRQKAATMIDGEAFEPLVAQMETPQLTPLTTRSAVRAGEARDYQRPVQGAPINGL
ncbi:MAG TPA: hypothetical protein DDZ68_04475 [Parvularcula sp.]|nr:hypothetical protein [Parvularcula sp.]HBS31228.1 hypothetical protein [Parvularcula sp.]